MCPNQNVSFSCKFLSCGKRLGAANNLSSTEYAAVCNDHLKARPCLYRHPTCKYGLLLRNLDLPTKQTALFTIHHIMAISFNFLNSNLDKSARQQDISL